MKNYKPKRMVSIVVMISLFFTLVLLTNSAQAAELDGAGIEFGLEVVDEPADPEDIDILREYGDLLTDEQLAVLETAFLQMKDSIMAAEEVYQDAIKALKDKYCDTVQDAVKSIEDEKELTAVLDRLKAEILAEYEAVQRTLDSEVYAARESFRKAADKALVPVEITDAIADWHVNKELNAANELINFIESFKNLSGNGNNGQGQGMSGENAGQQNVNSEQNKETNQNKTEQQNTEQEKQKEKNEEGNLGRSQQQGQSQSNGKGGKGKGGN